MMQMIPVSVRSIRDDVTPSGAEREPDRHFLLTLHRAQQHQHGDVGADDHEHEADRDRDPEQDRTQAAEPAIARRLQPHAGPVVRNRRRRRAPRGFGEPALRRGRRNSLAQAHHVGADRRRMRNQQVDARAVAAEVEAGREDADDPERLGRPWTGLRFSANQPSDRAGIGSETVAPECVADERDRLGSGGEILGDQPASGSDATPRPSTNPRVTRMPRSDCV